MAHEDEVRPQLATAVVRVDGFCQVSRHRPGRRRLASPEDCGGAGLLGSRLSNHRLQFSTATITGASADRTGGGGRSNGEAGQRRGGGGGLARGGGGTGGDPRERASAYHRCPTG